MTAFLMHTRKAFFPLVLAMVGLTLLACAGSERPKPAPLPANIALIGVRPVWTNAVGNVGFPLDVRVVGDTVFVASSDGTVAAILAATGSDVWRTNVGSALSAGVGSDGRYAAVISKDNELIMLVAGKPAWRQKLSAATQTSPLVAGARVFTLSADRSVAAFDAASGKRLWQQQRSGDALVLGQSGLLAAVGDTLVAGLGGRMVGMNPQNGTSRWEAVLASSRGANEVERLVDLVSGFSREGSQICARAFQYAVGCVDAGTGKLVWTKAANGSSGVAGDAVSVFGPEEDGKLVAWSRTNGERLWVSERLRFRSLTTPLSLGRSMVVGDDAGNVHFLSKEDGSPLNRLPTDESGISVAPVLAGQTLVVVTRKGSVRGFRPD